MAQVLRFLIKIRTYPHENHKPEIKSQNPLQKQVIHPAEYARPFDRHGERNAHSFMGAVPDQF